MSTLLLLALPAAADTFTLANNGAVPWSSTSTWLQNGVPASRTPGSLAGTIDVVNLTATLYTVTVDVTPAEQVEIHTTCPSNTSTCILAVPAGGGLRLSGASTIGKDARVQLSGGIIDNAGTLDFALASRLDMSAGTLKGFGSTDIAFDSVTPAQWNISGGTLDGHTVNLHGKATQTGSWAINNSGHVNITVNGIFDIQTTGPITTNNPGLAKITNGGTFEKTSGGGGTNVDVPVHNNGIVKAWASALVLGGNPTHTNGTFNVALGCTVEIHGTFAGNCAIAGAGDAVIVGTPVIDNGATLAIENLTMAGGWIQGPVTGSASATVSGKITFHGGVWQRNLTVTMLNGSLLHFTGNAAAFIHDAHVINDANATIELNAGGGLGINSGGHVTNNGTFRLANDATILSDGLNNARIDNAATFEKTGGGGSANIQVVFNNNGNASTLIGTLNFTKDGSHGGSFFAGTGCLIEFSGGTHTVAGSPFNGATGFTMINGATFLTGDGGATIGTQLIQSAGTITGTTQLTVNNAFQWNGGSQTGTGETILSGAFNHFFNGSNGPMFLSRKLTNNGGTINYGALGTNVFNIDSGGWLHNLATFNITGDVPINSN
ncbi:MAG TPA: hypothetical protein VHL59_09825, partial [Thermoanaerobaculia bacterium]|nr:hypothetical protein [Thermoanaerobaculia bacterium]